MLITATFLGCAACVKAYQFWANASHGAVCASAPGPTLGMHGALVELSK